MAEPYLPSIKDFDFFFKFLFAYFFIQVWANLVGQKIEAEDKPTEEDYEKTIARLEAKPATELNYYEKIELTASKRELENIKNNPISEDQKKIYNQRRKLFKFVFLSTSMFIFAFVMIGFLDVPARDIGKIAAFIFVTGSLLKYLFDVSLTDGQVRMIVFAGLSLYVDEFREMLGRVSAQF